MSQPKRVFRKIGKFVAYAVAIVVATLTIAHFAWKYSGSNQWELWQDKDGVAIYTLKVPGATRLQFKVITRIHTTLDRVVAVMTDTTTDGCRNFIRGCNSGRIFKPFDEQSLNYIQAYRIVVKPRLLPRDLAVVNKVQLSRDPRTKALLVSVTGVPELLPSDPCCFNMTHLDNHWRFTPLENDMIELEFTENDDPGIPYWLYNRFLLHPKAGMRRASERAFNREKYRNAEFAFLKEL